ncbi:MAG: BMP family ABC transporter substrate-binding protein [Candidatus Erginobacter occultus]|nr:BMP family ABC transporter substrate-binding protein [Candidatus Erginobacter occultus]
MKKHWKYWAAIIFLPAVAAASLTGCGKPAEKSGEQPLKVGFVYISPVGDAGWTYAHDRGRAEMEKLPFIETARAVESVAETADATRVMTQLAAQGCNLIFSTSYGYMEQTLAAAKRFPEVVFMHCSGHKTAPNMSTYFGKMYQARYLTGMVAGKMTGSNLIGYVAAHPIPEVIRGINAFTLGVRKVNPEAKVRVVWTYTWFDPPKERQAAVSLIEVGADVIAQHQDTPGPQQAAEEAGKYSIGYNVDMAPFAPRAHLTGAVWDWGVVYTAVAEAVHEGTWTNQPIWWGIETGLVGLAPFGPMVPDEVRQLVKAEETKIAAGQLKIFSGPIRGQDGEVVIPKGKSLSDEELFSMSYFVEGVEGEIPR